MFISIAPSFTLPFGVAFYIDIFNEISLSRCSHKCKKMQMLYDETKNKTISQGLITNI